MTTGEGPLLLSEETGGPLTAGGADTDSGGGGRRPGPLPIPDLTSPLPVAAAAITVGTPSHPHSPSPPLCSAPLNRTQDPRHKTRDTGQAGPTVELVV